MLIFKRIYYFTDYLTTQSRVNENTKRQKEETIKKLKR